MERVVDVSTDGLHLSVYRGFLIASEKGQETGRVALDDIVSVVVHAHGVTWTTNLMVALAERGANVVICGPNHLPAAICHPVSGHHAQNARMRFQREASRPLEKRIWRRLIVSKILWQATVLRARGKEADGLEALARKVRSGDPDNVEAIVARRYWPALMGQGFVRERGMEGANSLLNYGYTIMRTLVARSVVASGLHPSIGIHHANRGNPFALADDLIEPFRPVVDMLTMKILDRGLLDVDRRTKPVYARLIGLDLPFGNGVTTVSLEVQRLAQSLARCFETSDDRELALPSPMAPQFLKEWEPEIG